MGQEVHCREEESIRAANQSTACHFAAICLEQGLNPKKTFSRLKGITVSTEPFPVA
jgi:hypothetical protein